MNYKLVAIDCDGTLLDSTGNIPSDNIQAINLLKSKGINIIISTGRSDLLAKDYIDELDIKAPIIGCNGASITNLYTKEVIYTDPIKESVVKQVFEYCTTNQIPIKAITLDTAYTNDKTMYEKGISLIVKKYTKVLKSTLPIKLADDLYPLLQTEKFLKLVIINDDYETLSMIQSDLQQIDNIRVLRSAHNCIDITAYTATKGNAVKQYAESLGISQSEVLAIGDSENDVPMLQYAALGVAMGNAEQVVKDNADIITDTNDNCGVAKILKKIFNL